MLLLVAIIMLVVTRTRRQVQAVSRSPDCTAGVALAAASCPVSAESPVSDLGAKARADSAHHASSPLRATPAAR